MAALADRFLVSQRGIAQSSDPMVDIDASSSDQALYQAKSRPVQILHIQIKGYRHDITNKF